MRWISQLLCLIFNRHFKSWGHFNSQAEESSLAVAKGLQALDEAAEIEEQGEKSGCTHISHSFITLKHTWYADKYGTAWMQSSRTGAHKLMAIRLAWCFWLAEAKSRPTLHCLQIFGTRAWKHFPHSLSWDACLRCVCTLCKRLDRQKIPGVVDVDWMWLISIRGISINSAIRVWLKSIRAFFCLFPWLKSIRAVIEINQGGFQSGLFTFNHVLDWNDKGKGPGTG